jgi:5-formyltetrahydrofolate cyclo-ligase
MVASPQPIADRKRTLRREMAERRAGLPQAEREACARAVAARLLALPGVVAAGERGAWLSGYVAIRGELDPAETMAVARAAGLRVALPRIHTAKPPWLSFHQVGEGEPLAAGPHGISEPVAWAPEVPVEDLEVLLVPGVAFDAAGRRLGLGGGYYDEVGRRRRPGGLMIGLCYDFQVVDACPADERDVAVDLVVTERRVLGSVGGTRA